MPKVADKKKGASYKKERPEGVIVRYQGYRFRIYPTAEQAAQFAKTFGCARWVYNFYLSERNEVYKNTGKTLTFTDFNNAINQLKKHPYFNWLKEVDKFSLSNAILNAIRLSKTFLRVTLDFHASKANEKANKTIQPT
ncbi:helix-turn-helix domain-containing protein [Aneurinibacillus tyrosinisolvens]|uniref:helix-turn-helix domain-containing protein n=1 Tax=Aneurinibacillus tyrosinisolvens TaxID=1443435 RepID=UPI00069A4D58|nr:helix-turn-helix domain-containing protein [Aneurinibacillus tyrosinisolvens]